MSTLPSPKAPRVRHTRKSIAHLPPADLVGDKENATIDSGALSSLTGQLKERVRKSRSKSIGPGGLDALKEGAGNKTVRVQHHQLRRLGKANKNAATPPSEVDLEAHNVSIATKEYTTKNGRPHAFT